MKKWIASLALGIALTSAEPSPAVAQQDYPPGELRLAPKVDLHLQPTPIEGLPGRLLNLPPGFKIKLFSNRVNKARFMAFDRSEEHTSEL